MNDDGKATQKLCFEGIWAWLIKFLFWYLVCRLILLILHRIIVGPYYRKHNRIDNKVVIITGCNKGIGKETALELARRGARVYMACRDAERCEATRLHIIDKTHNPNVFNRTLDLSSLSSVRQFAERFLAEETRLDILINNAGVMASPRLLTADGFEQQFGINHLGHFLLTNLLIDRLRQSGPSRVIVVSSDSYMMGSIKKDDLMSEKNYSKDGAYAQSKLANILFTRKLSELLEDTNVTVNCLHPGIVRTDSRRYDYTQKVWKCLMCLLWIFMRSPRAGAQTSIYLAMEPNMEDSTGGYYFNSFRFPLLPKARNIEMANWLWLESEKLVGLKQTEQLQKVDKAGLEEV